MRSGAFSGSVIVNYCIMAEQDKDIKQSEEQPSSRTEEEQQIRNSERHERKALHREEKKVAELEAKVASLTDNLSKEKNDYLRLMAEFETFRRRSAEDRVKLVDTAAADTIKGLLPVLDDCERALQILEKSDDSSAKEGTKLIYDKLFAYLKSCGLEPIKAKGEKFDTDFHEAVTQFPAPSEDMKGKVVDVIQTGYTLHGKVLRYAKVVVGV